MNEAGGISRGIDLMCRNDGEAVAAARDHPHAYPKELWQAESRLAIIAPDRKAVAA
jgi:hypothetical protein